MNKLITFLFPIILFGQFDQVQNGFGLDIGSSGSGMFITRHYIHASEKFVLNGELRFYDIKAEDEIFYVIPKTHHLNFKPSQEYCHKNKISISAKAGSILVFDSTLWHCGGPNHSKGSWFGVNHQFTKSFLKQQIDYVRLLGEETVLQQSPRVQQMLGYYTRVVTSLDEYYQPNEKRLYRANQG